MKGLEAIYSVTTPNVNQCFVWKVAVKWQRISKLKKHQDGVLQLQLKTQTSGGPKEVVSQKDQRTEKALQKTSAWKALSSEKEPLPLRSTHCNINRGRSCGNSTALGNAVGLAEPFEVALAYLVKFRTCASLHKMDEVAVFSNRCWMTYWESKWLYDHIFLLIEKYVLFSLPKKCACEGDFWSLHYLEQSKYEAQGS